MWWFYRKGPSGFSGASSAEEVTAGVDGRGLVAVITGKYFRSAPVTLKLFHSASSRVPSDLNLCRWIRADQNSEVEVLPWMPTFIMATDRTGRSSKLFRPFASEGTHELSRF